MSFIYDSFAWLSSTIKSGHFVNDKEKRNKATIKLDNISLLDVFMNYDPRETFTKKKKLLIRSI